MSKRSPFAAAAAALAMLAVPAAPLAATPPSEGGTISVEQPAGDAPPDRDTAAFVAAVDDALAARGFTLLTDPGHSALVAEFAVTRTVVGEGSDPMPRERGAVIPGAAPGMGAAVILPLSAARTRAVPLERVRLEVRVRRRGQGAVLWRGAALTVRAASADPGAAERTAASLSEAVIRLYPRAMSGDVTVP